MKVASTRIFCGFMIVLAQIPLSGVFAMPSGHQSFLGGPWELLVQMGHEGEGIRFPITVSDCNKVSKLSQILPVMGTPLKVKLESYLPDLRWETTAKQGSGGAAAAKIVFTGANLHQEMWLSTSDPAKQSISSSIGGIKLIELHDANTLKSLPEELDPKTVGILSIWPNDSNIPLEFIACLSKTITMPNSGYKIRIAEYLPHYSYDNETKRVSNISNEPQNPAIRVSLDDNKSVRDAWVWARFGTYPHMQKQVPLRMEFASFDMGSSKGEYMLLIAPRTEPRMLLRENDKLKLRPIKAGDSFELADKKYSFTVESIMRDSILETKWKNNSENLLHPALIATLEDETTNEEIVIEFDKPCHQKTKSGTVVLLYRKLSLPSKGTAK